MSVKRIFNHTRRTYLKEREEVVKLLACRTLIEVDTRSLEHEVDETDAEEIVGQIKWIQPPWNWRTTVAKGHDLVHDIKDDGMFDQAVIVNFRQVLDLRDAPLVVLEVMLLQTSTDRLDDVVNHIHDELCAVPIKVRQQRGKKMDCTVFDLSGLGEYLFQGLSNLDGHVSVESILQLMIAVTYFCLFPVHPADLSCNLIKSPFRQVHID